MTDKTRIKIAAIVTTLFLAGISAIGLAARSDAPAPAPAKAVQPQPTSATVARPPGTPDDEHGQHEGREEHAVDG